MAFEVVLSDSMVPGPDMPGPHEPDQVQGSLSDSAQQSKMKAIGNLTTDETRWAHLHLLFRPGELILVCAGPVLKGLSPYQGPYEAKEVLRHYTFLLSDGQCWSACRMQRWIEDPTLMTEVEAPELIPKAISMQPVPISKSE